MYEPSLEQLQILQATNRKYYNKIKNAYRCYVEDFDSIPDMTKNTFIEPELKERGRCDADTGFIYIREDVFNSEAFDNVIVHEFIHRLSRKYDNAKWSLGISGQYKAFNLDFMNELLTEYLTVTITKYSENSLYQNALIIIKYIKKYHPLKFGRIVRFYYNCEYGNALKMLLRIFPSVIDDQNVFDSLQLYSICPTEDNLNNLKKFLRYPI